MIRLTRAFLLILGCSLLIFRCAQITPLTGGGRDATAPKLLKSVPENKSTSFQADVILLQFDEYVQVKDVANQILISPTIKTAPEIESLGKKIRIQLKRNELLPNTTYRIGFGKAIADMHEGNALNNLEYIFSTGPTLDTLQISGTIKNAFTETNEVGVVVGLFKSTDADSLIYKQTPFYYTRTREDGSYTISNVAKNAYRLIAFTDANKNLTYDGISEQIGFYKDTLRLKTDTSLTVNVFKEEPTRCFLKKSISNDYGYTLLIYNTTLKSSQVRCFNKADETHTSLVQTENDSISIYYKTINDSLWLLQKTEKAEDTLRIRLPKAKWMGKKRLTLNTNLQNGQLGLASSLVIESNKWLDSTSIKKDKALLIHLNDSTRELLNWRMKPPNELYITNTLKPGQSYQLKLDTAFIKDYEGNYNDSLAWTFKTQTTSELGRLLLTLRFNKKQNYIVQLINGTKNTVREQKTQLALAETNLRTLDFKDLSPGEYKVRVIVDENENGKWDTGNYIKKQLPEHIKTYDKGIKVIADWEVEEEILITD